MPADDPFIEEVVRDAAGGMLRLRWTRDGHPTCPICDMIWPVGAEPAWEKTGETTPDGVPIVTPSWGICPRCDTEFGLDDVRHGEPVSVTWDDLRKHSWRVMGGPWGG